MKWLRAQCQGYADTMAALVLFDEKDEAAALCDLMHATVGTANTNELSETGARSVTVIMFKDAMERGRAGLERVRWAILPLVRERRPGADIIAAATKAADRSDFHIPTDALIEHCRRIAHAQPQRRVANR